MCEAGNCALPDANPTYEQLEAASKVMEEQGIDLEHAVHVGIDRGTPEESEVYHGEINSYVKHDYHLRQIAQRDSYIENLKGEVKHHLAKANDYKNRLDVIKNTLKND
jgi:hypothetical protein